MWLRLSAVCMCLAVGVPAALASGCRPAANVALGKPVTVMVTGNDAAAVGEGESAADVTDGSRAYLPVHTRQEDGCVGWHNGTRGGRITVSVRIDLQAIHNISSMRYHTGDTSRADAWAADTVTTPLGTTSANTGRPGTGAWTTHCGSMTASEVSVTLTKTNSGLDRNWLFIGEIEVYGTPVAPPSSVLLPVPFLAQFQPGLVTTGNCCCGPASLSMCAAYKLGRNPTKDDIVAIMAYVGRPQDCSGTGGTPWNELLSASSGVFGLSNVKYAKWTIPQIKAELVAGGPLIVGVKAGCLTNRGYSYTGGHYIVAIGYDPDSIICNDPGTSYSQPKHYSNADFEAAITAVGSGIPNGVIYGFAR